MIDGQELVGTKQNRIINTSVLVPENSKIKIPVSCVERGRWNYSSQKSDSGHQAFSTLRKNKALAVTDSLRSRNAYEADQSRVWNDVEDKINACNAESPTHSMYDAYERISKRLQDYLAAFPRPDAACGVLFYMNGRPECADLFSHNKTLGRHWSQLITSYAMDALTRRPRGRLTTPGEADAESFLARLKGASFEAFKSVGIGDDVRISHNRIMGAGLVWDTMAVHVCLFNPEEADPHANDRAEFLRIEGVAGRRIRHAESRRREDAGQKP